MSKQFLLIIIVFIGVAAASSALGFYLAGERMAQQLQAASQDKQELLIRLQALESTVDMIATDASSVRTAFISELEQKTREQQEAQEAVQMRLQELQKNLSTQETKIQAVEGTADITSVITSWNTYVYEITCLFESTEGKLGKGRGSATLERVQGGVRFITNKHVLETPGAKLIECDLAQPGSDVSFSIDAKDISVNEENDIGYGPVKEAVFGMLPWQKCSEAPVIGERVIILGYPGIGAKVSVTATEGIISGFDSDYYTTSAKIEKGNSGGAAIDIKRNCFLGLPTLVFAGKIESLARILPVFRITY